MTIVLNVTLDSTGPLLTEAGGWAGADYGLVSNISYDKYVRRSFFEYVLMLSIFF